jgi:hypothetical protein
MSISLSIAKSSLELGLPLLLGRDLASGDSARFPHLPHRDWSFGLKACDFRETQRLEENGIAVMVSLFV